VRQVDRAELTYRLYSALRKWSFSRRRAIFDHRSERQATIQRIAADSVIADLRGLHFHEAGQHKAAAHDLVAATVERAISAFPGAIPALWQSRIHDRETEARAAAANLIADALDRFEILADPPELSNFSIADQMAMFRFPDIRIAPHALSATWP